MKLLFMVFIHNSNPVRSSELPSVLRDEAFIETIDHISSPKPRPHLRSFRDFTRGFSVAA